MARNVSPSWHDLICEMTRVARCGKHSIKAIRLNPQYFWITKAPLYGEEDISLLRFTYLEVLGEHFLYQPEP